MPDEATDQSGALTRAEVCKRLRAATGVHYSPSRFKHECLKGRGPTFREVDGDLVFDEADVAPWIEERRLESEAQRQAFAEMAARQSEQRRARIAAANTKPVVALDPHAGDLIWSIRKHPSGKPYLAFANTRGRCMTWHRHTDDRVVSPEPTLERVNLWADLFARATDEVPVDDLSQ